MTTIVVDVKNAKVYSDTLCSTYQSETVGGENVTNLVKYTTNQYKKIYKFEQYVIIGAGCMDTLKDFSENYQHDILITPRNETVIAILSKRQHSISVIIFETIEEKQSWWKRILKRPKKYVWKSYGKLLKGEWHTFGSGKYIAIGALKAGASIQDTFSIVASVDNSTNDIIDFCDIP